MLAGEQMANKSKKEAATKAKAGLIRSRLL